MEPPNDAKEFGEDSPPIVPPLNVREFMTPRGPSAGFLPIHPIARNQNKRRTAAQHQRRRKPAVKSRLDLASNAEFLPRGVECRALASPAVAVHRIANAQRRTQPVPTECPSTASPASQMAPIVKTGHRWPVAFHLLRRRPGHGGSLRIAWRVRDCVPVARFSRWSIGGLRKMDVPSFGWCMRRMFRSLYDSLVRR